MNKILYLASKSKSRQDLLKKIDISFIVIKQDIQEPEPDLNLSLEENVRKIAIYKMDNLVLPASSESQNETRFILTADTLGQNFKGEIHGKPLDYNDAISKIKSLNNQPGLCCTAFCLDKKIYKNNQWVAVDRIIKAVVSSYIFEVPDYWINKYLESTQAINASGGIAIENFGAQFLKSINGSYSAILGLPLFELRQALESLNFFNF